MDGRALTRLRIAFLLLGAALLLPLGLLLRSVDTRLEAQRRLRHELVAERIFDEMESELSALLAREEARPSDAYVDADTRVENWAPFVVGYFTRDQHGARIVAKPQLAPDRLHRLEATLDLAAAAEDEPSGAPPAPAAPSSTHEALEGAQPLEDGASAERAVDKRKGASRALPEVTPAKSKSSARGIGAAVPAASSAQRIEAVPEAVLKQLNRAAELREREQTRPASKRKADDSEISDPLSGFE